MRKSKKTKRQIKVEGVGAKLTLEHKQLYVHKNVTLCIKLTVK